MIVSCSAKKKPTTSAVPALDLYDGPAYQIIRRLQRLSIMPDDVDILVLSAKYGLISSDTAIQYYDQLMSKDVAAVQRLRNVSVLHRLMRENGYSQVFINAGKVYLSALEPFSDWAPSGVFITIAAGGIGQKNSQMRNWLVNTRS